MQEEGTGHCSKHAQEERFFSRTESNSTKTAVDQIAKAAEAKKPKLRYVAPWRQGAFVTAEKNIRKIAYAQLHQQLCLDYCKDDARAMYINLVGQF